MPGQLNKPVFPDRGEHALQLRLQLLATLAPDARCASCGTVHELELLEIDHVDGRTWRWHSLNALDRVRREWREYERGVPLRALCRHCNASDGARLRGAPRYQRRAA